MPVQSSIPIDQFQAVLQETALARGLPARLYVDRDAFMEERDRVFANTWTGLGFASDIPEPGDVRPVDWLGFPLLMVRDRQRQVRVFHNVCSHRGRQLVDASCRLRGGIRCPYHAWTYDFTGDLLGTPHIGGVNRHETSGFNRRDHGLQEVPSSVWFDTVFVNVAGNAPSFQQFIAPVEARWAPCLGADGVRQLHAGGSDSRQTLEVGCNWKLAVENYCESYHLPFVHRSLNSYSRLEDHYEILDGDEEGYSGQGTLAYTLVDTAGIELPTLPHWPASRLREAEYLSLYPNVLLGLQADHGFVVLLEPRSEQMTIEHLRLLFVGEAARSDAHADARAQVRSAWEGVFLEDVGMVEGMQRGRRSPAHRGGAFSPVMDRPTHHFHRWVARQLLADT